MSGRLDDESELQVSSSSTLLNNGTLNVLSGRAADPNWAYNVLGTGTIQVSVGALFDLKDFSAATQTIRFNGVGGVIEIDTVNDFKSPIVNFLPDDVIYLGTIPATSASYNAATDTLTAFETLGNQIFAVATLAVTGPTTSGSFQVVSDGASGAFISYANQPSTEKFAITAADHAMGSDVARATLKTHAGAVINGTGVTIGIISGSFNSLGGANNDALQGYLPLNAAGTGSGVVQLAADQPGQQADEGRAMAELVHQVAPGAQIDFFPAPGNEQEMAAGITQMVSAGVNIIVDDLDNTDEPFFQVAGPIDTAIQDAINAGVSYFTAAGNFGNAYYQAAFKPTTTTLAGVPGTVAAQTFSDGTTLQTITLTVPTTIALQWDAPFPQPGGTAPLAMAMALYQNGVAQPQIATQTADPTTGFASEPEISFANVPAGTYQVAIYQTAGMPAVSMFKYSLFGGGSGTGPGGYIDDPAAMNGVGNVFGHELVPGVNTVAAVDFENTPTFTGDDFTDNESDNGPGELLFDSSGNRLAQPLADGKPNFSAPEGVYLTSDLTGFPAFLRQFRGRAGCGGRRGAHAAGQPNLDAGPGHHRPRNLRRQPGSFGQPAGRRRGAGGRRREPGPGGGLLYRRHAIADPAWRGADRAAPPRRCHADRARHRPAGSVARPSPGRLSTSPGSSRSLAGAGARPVAFGGNVPHRDLLLSPDHAVAVEDVLIPIRCLINGRSIAQLRRRQLSSTGMSSSSGTTCWSPKACRPKATSTPATAWRSRMAAPGFSCIPASRPCRGITPAPRWCRTDRW